MIDAIQERLLELGTRGVDYELGGFGWFQGWSDTARKPDWVEDEYEENMVDFMKDVRVAFNEFALPFILAGPGMRGFQDKQGGKGAICEAQKRATERPEFIESTAYVESRHFASK